MSHGTTKTARILYALGFVALVIVEVLIALYVHDSFIRPYGGDIIVIWVLYCFVRIFFPKKLRLLPLYLFLFAVAVEIGQYFNYAALLGLDGSPFFLTLLGSSFSWLDIACYGVGSAVSFAVQEIFALLEKSNSATKSHR